MSHFLKHNVFNNPGQPWTQLPNFFEVKMDNSLVCRFTSASAGYNTLLNYSIKNTHHKVF